MPDTTSTKRPMGRPKGAIPPKDKYYHYLFRIPPEMAAQIQARADANYRDFRRQLLLIVQRGLEMPEPPERVPPARATSTPDVPEVSNGR